MLADMLGRATLGLGTLILVTVLARFVSTKTQLFVLFAVVACGGLLVAFGTISKNKWGMNFSAVSCPRCGALLPAQRQPRSRRQQLWGGWTCSFCGAEVDKWGRERLAGSP